MASFLRNLILEFKSKVALSYWAVLVIFVVVAGPFGTYQTMTFLPRLIAVFTALPLLLLTAVVIRAAIYAPLQPRGFRIAALTTAFVAGLVMGPMAHFLFTILVDRGHILAPGQLEFSILIGCLSLGHSSLRQHLTSNEAKRNVAAEEIGAENRVRLLDRVDPNLRGELLAICVRNHYVDVYTDRGTANLLLRFGDAISEVDIDAGTQVHRSHWVAWHAIIGVERDGIRLFLKLKHGLRIPVSKNHREKLEQRGLI